MRPRTIAAVVSGVLAVAITAMPSAVSAQGNAVVARSGDSAGLRQLVRFASQVIPAGSKIVGAVASNTTISGQVELQPNDPSALADFASSVSDPSSPDYRHYLAKGRFGPLFGASSASIDSVEQWLESRGLHDVAVSSDRLAVSFEAPASTVDSAFGLHIERFTTESREARFAPDSEPLVPASLTGEIEGILGLSDLGVPQPLIERSIEPRNAKTDGRAATVGTTAQGPHVSGPSACSTAETVASEVGGYTSNQLATAYSIDAEYAQDRTGQGISVALYELEPFESSDISAFQSCYGTDSAVNVTDVDGGPGSGYGSGEAALDIEQVIGLAPGASIHVYEGPIYTEATAAEALAVYQQIANDDSSAVVSTSWGECEPELGSVFAHAETPIFEQMASQGQSIFAASGDSGSEDCYQAGNFEDTSLAVDDPGTQQYVVSVGGTSMQSVGPAPSEVVWNGCQGQHGDSCAAQGQPYGAGGGGISTIWSMPSWQTGPGVVNSYSSGSPCGALSGDCREVPDVSASADPDRGVMVFYDGEWIPVGGTSAAAPLWAAIAAITDQGCLGPGGALSGSHAIGFPDQLLYQLGAGGSPPFNDVTSGNDDFTDTNSNKYQASTHYDLATGWGTPIASSLVPDLQPAGGCPSVSGVSPSQGATAGGSVVSISGSDLAGVTGVDFGSVGATNVSYNSSNHTVTATAPASSSRGNVAVTVTTGNGTSARSNYGLFDYIGPSVSSLDPPAGSPAGATLVQINGGGFTGATAVLFGSDAAESFTVVSDSLIRAVSPPGANGSEANVTVSTPIGTSPRSAVHNFIYTLGPVLKSVSPASGTTRGGTTVTISGANLKGASRVYFGSTPASFKVSGPDTITATAPASPQGARSVGINVVGSLGQSAGWGEPRFTYQAPRSGYWFVAADGGVFAFGASGFHGSMGGKTLDAPIVAMAATENDQGYWLVASDGGIFAFGNATFHGSMGGKHLNAPIVGMAATPDGGGYWLVASDGGIFAFGDADFYGSMGGRQLNAPIVGMAATADGHGYWLVASDGGMFSFGDSTFHGSMGGKHLNAPIVGMAATVGGGGYWLVASDGGIFAFGDAVFRGSMGGRHLNEPIVGIATTAVGGGYWLVAADGGIFAYGAVFSGSTGDLKLVAKVVGMTPT